MGQPEKKRVLRPAYKTADIDDELINFKKYCDVPVIGTHKNAELETDEEELKNKQMKERRAPKWQARLYPCKQFCRGGASFLSSKTRATASQR